MQDGRGTDTRGRRQSGREFPAALRDQMVSHAPSEPRIAILVDVGGEALLHSGEDSSEMDDHQIPMADCRDRGGTTADLVAKELVHRLAGRRFDLALGAGR